MRSLRVHAAVLLFFTAAAVGMTWPLAVNLSRGMAHPGDPYIVTWILDWEFYAATHDGARVFDGNIFHPLPLTLAFTENMLGVLLVLLPLFLARVPILLIYNIAVLAGYALSGYGAAILGRRLTGSTGAGLVAGVFFAFVPWRFSHLTHLQHLWTLWLPLTLLALFLMARQPHWKRAAWLAVAFLMNGLTNLHWFAFGLVAFTGCALLLGLFRDRPLRLRYWSMVAAALTAGTVAMTPVLLQYWRAQRLYPMRGDAGETMQYSSTPSAWLIASLHNRLYGPLTNDGTVNPELWAFPGLLGALLAMIGLLVCLRRRDSEARSAAAVGFFLVILGFVGSLGMHTFFGRVLFEQASLFRGIRAPARWAMIAYLGMVILIAYGAQWMAKRRGVSALLVVLLLFELRAAPIRWYLATGHTPAVYAWLAQQRFPGAVLELPMDQASTYAYLYSATVHHKPLINGVSGFKPRRYAELEQASLETPLPDSFFDRFVRHEGTLLVVHEAILGDRQAAAGEWLRRQVAAGRLKEVARFGSDAVFARPGFTASPVNARPSMEGALEHPVHWEQLTGALEVRGSMSSPRPIRKVLLYFDNRRTVFPAEVRGNAFGLTFRERPPSVRIDTDLQVELVDVTGERHRLPQVWLRWLNRGESGTAAPLPQTADLGPYLIHPKHADSYSRTRAPR